MRAETPTNSGIGQGSSRPSAQTYETFRPPAGFNLKIADNSEVRRFSTAGSPLPGSKSTSATIEERAMRRVLLGCLTSGALLCGPQLLKAADSADPAPPAGSQTAHDELFVRLDANHDGRLEASEIPADKQRLFERLLRNADKDHDGSLDRTEFQSALADHRPERPVEERESADAASQSPVFDVAEVFARLDTNKDGKITRDEVPDEARQRFEQLLARGDKNNDGILTREEVQAVLDYFQPQNLQKQARNPAVVFRYLDTDNDGKLAVSEVPGERREGFEKMLAHFDKDGDGKLNEQEFTAGMKFAQAMGLGQSAPEKPAGSPPAKKDDSPAKDKPAKGPLAKLLAGGFDPDKATQRLMQLDKDRDGKLSREEAGRLGERFFENFDTNRDGAIDQAEIHARLELLKKRPASE